jgi:hypothetical protein
MNRTSVAIGSVLGSAALAAAALAGASTSVAAGPVASGPADSGPAAGSVRTATAPLPKPVVTWSKKHGHKVASFDLVRSTASVAKGCLPYAKAKVSIEQTEEVEIMKVYASGLPKNTEFDFFVLQQPDAPFGLSWYQGDLQSDKNGRAYVKYVGRFNEETFSVAPNVLPAPVTHDDQPFPDADKNPATPPVHQYHLGFWFNSPKDAAKAGCLDATTPFNGEHNAGVQAMSTRQFPALAGPLSRIKP